jgi:predicted dehydrogenase
VCPQFDSAPRHHEIETGSLAPRYFFLHAELQLESIVKGKRKIVLGQIGVGNWGPKLLRNFMMSGIGEVRLVCDLKKSRYDKLDLGEGGPSYTSDYHDILSDPEIEGVVVATPSDTHYSLGREILRAGKHLFVEKPLALSSREAGRLVDLAREAGRIIMVGHLMMYHPGIQTLSRLVREGTIGKVFFIGIRRRNLGRLQNDCSVLWDLGPHDISIALKVVGQTPLRVVTTGQSYLQPGMPEVAFTTITFEGGVQAHLEESWLAPERERELVVVGEKGMIVFDELAATPLKLFKKFVQLRGRAEVREFDYLDSGTDTVEVAADQPLATECRHFLECIRDGTEPLSGGENGLQVLRVLEAADRSLKAGGKITPVAGGAR